MSSKYICFIRFIQTNYFATKVLLFLIYAIFVIKSHNACTAVRAVVVVEAMAALVLQDIFSV